MGSVFGYLMLEYVARWGGLVASDLFGVFVVWAPVWVVCDWCLLLSVN